MEFFWANILWLVLAGLFVALVIAVLSASVRVRDGERPHEFSSGMPDLYAEEVARLNDRYDRGEIDDAAYGRERRRLDEF